MTIVVAVVTPDGLVLASDSATTQQLMVGQQTTMGSIWNSANKIVNLRKCWPIGAMTFGRATFAGRSIATHCKDLRASISSASDQSSGEPWNEAAFTVEAAARAVHDHFGPLYRAEPGGILGFLVGGFGGIEQSPEMWQVLIGEDGEAVEQLMPPGEAGIFHQGMTDAITRLVDGAGQGLGQALAAMQVDPSEAERAADQARQMLSIPLAWQGMPLGEAIDLARFLVDTTINFVRFSPGHAMVGGPIEIAAVTKHEGFKWVQRKHYYQQDLNPMEGSGSWS